MADPPAQGRMERANAPDGKAALWILAGPMTSASWRAKVLLTKGRYGFEGKVRTEGVEPLALGKNQGASLRVVGVPAGKTDRMLGREDWKTLRVEFDIAGPEQEVELTCELRARRGQCWFDLYSLRLIRLPAASLSLSPMP